MKIAFIHNKDYYLGKLTEVFTGSDIYHVGYVTDDGERFYDMNLVKRMRPWQGLYTPDKYYLFDCNVTEEYLLRDIASSNAKISSRSVWYGFVDYFFFALRPIYHALGKSTRNYMGIICSEWCNDTLLDFGYNTGFPIEEGPPSPYDLYKYFQQRVNNGTK